MLLSVICPAPGFSISASSAPRGSEAIAAIDPARGPRPNRCRASAAAPFASIDRTVAGHEETIGQRFQRDRAFARPLPATAFDPCIVQAACVDKYQTVRFDRNRYSVPRRLAFQ